VPSGIPFLPSFKVFRDGVLQPQDTIVGPEPLPLVFNMCESTGPFPLRFHVEVDGALTTAGCRSTIMFNTASAVAGSGRGAAGVRASANRVYAVTMVIRSQAPRNEPQAERRLNVEVIPAASAGCASDETGPDVRLTSPAPAPSSVPYPIHFEASASDANGVASVEYKVNYAATPQEVFGPVTSGAPWAFDWSAADVLLWLGADCSRLVDVQAYAVDRCENATYSPTVQILVERVCFTAGANGRPERAGTLVSDLGVAGGAGQVVVNDEAAFPRAGRSPLAVRLRPGENRVEATLVEGRSAGEWRFDVASMPGFRPESLRVIAGEVSQVGGGAVAFRLRGRAGERIVFSFRVEP
jgi:hypothetical protein